MELKNRFDSLFYNDECDSDDFKSESKCGVYTNENFPFFFFTFDNDFFFETLIRSQWMETVRDPSRSDYGEEMLTIVSFVDFALASNHVNVVFHIIGLIGR